ncbi:MAG: ferrous iron transport protein A [Actinomycetota bacterium]|nr:ferrous iron transport protein A [Actinomycetota bacterium]
MTDQVLAGVPIGARVVVRHLIEDGDRATDALGPLLEHTGTHLVVDTRRGRVRVALEDVVAAKAVPPAPARRRSAAGT